MTRQAEQIAGTVRSRLRYGREKMKGALMDMVEDELRANKPEQDFPSRITGQIESFLQNLFQRLPPDLLKIAAMSREEITHRNQEIFGSMEASLSSEQKARMKTQGYLNVEELTPEQQDVVRDGVHFLWAHSLL